MKIVNREEFLALGENVLYSHISSCYIDCLRIKMESLSYDFCYQEIIGEFDCDSGYDHVDILTDMHENGTETPLCLETGQRDGMYEEDQLFLIYDNDDVRRLIDRLNKCLK